MPKYNVFNKKELSYAYESIDKFYLEKGSFLAIKLTQLFIMNVSRGNELNFSNNYLIGRFNCSESGLQDAFKIAESNNIFKRKIGASSNGKTERYGFELNIEQAIEWMSVSKYDNSYKNAPKRSLFKAFVNQSVIFIKDTARRIKDELKEFKNKRDQKARASKIAAIKEKTDKKYNRYINHLENRNAKLAKKRLQASSKELLSEAEKMLPSFVTGLGFQKPPDRFKN